MSHVAIAAALALQDVSGGERLAAFSLASFANREQRAWPGTRVAEARAGLSRSQYLAAREGLERRELVVVEAAGGGRGNSPVIALTFALSGPWFDGEINPALFEAVLGHSRARGSARLLLAALAAVADDELEVIGLATEEIRAAAGMADSTYRRARAALLASGELELGIAGGGRARTNRWQLHDPRLTDSQRPLVARRRVAPSPTARPLVASAKEPPRTSAGDRTRRSAGRVAGVKGPGLSGVPVGYPGQIRTVSAANGPQLGGVSAVDPGQDRTVSPDSPPITPPQTPPETPPPNARAGREALNPGTWEHPPGPPDGGTRLGSVQVIEEYVTDRGRRRQRRVVVDLDEIRSQFRAPGDAELTDWQAIRSELRRVVGDQTFEIWLDQLGLAAVDQDGALVLAAPSATRAWVAKRFGRLLDRVAGAAGRTGRVAEERELQLLGAITLTSTAADAAPHFPNQQSHDQQEAVWRSPPTSVKT